MGRRAPPRQHPKLVVHVVDSFREFAAPPVDDMFIALGTTLKAAGSRNALAKKIARVAAQLLGGLIPANYQAISADKVAQALLREVAQRCGPHVLLSGEMQSA
ncbi:hypothetical protein LP416_04285 [Polaromonas sp. P2-4]|nr:hypothetical protein LP416_04285 [Polaromonas sp. P2-4]